MDARRRAALDGLPDTFRYREGARVIGERQLRRLISDGHLTTMSRGLYRKNELLENDDLLELAMKVPDGALCLRSALAHHDLIDDIPPEIDFAIPRGTWAPTITAPVQWRQFDPATFGIGRDLLDAGAGRTLGIYTPERSIIDAIRLAHLEGPDLGNQAIKAWLRRGGQPSALLDLAAAFPRTLSRVRHTLEILL